MRIVIVNKYAHLTGGADQHCLGLAEALGERGHAVRFLSTSDDRNTAVEGEFVPPTVTHESRDALSPRSQAKVLASTFWNARAADAMRRLVDDFSPDVVHAHKLYPQLSVAPVVEAARAGVPVVQTLHDFEMVASSPIDARARLWDPDETRVRFKLLNSALRPVRRRVHVPRVSAFVAVSRFVARVHARHGIDAATIPNFVATDGTAFDQLPVFSQRRGVVFVGRLRTEKGARDVAGLAERVPDVPVTIVGSGDLEAELRREARRLPNLDVLGFVPNDRVPEILRAARVAVVPSRCQEAASLAALEAMGQATPIVAYAVGGLAEYVTDAGGGRIVPVDVDALAAAVDEVHGREDLWLEHARRGFEAVTTRHTPAAYALAIERVYEGVCRRSS